MKLCVYVSVVLFVVFGLLMMLMVCSLDVSVLMVVVIGWCVVNCGVISKCGCMLKWDLVLSSDCSFVCMLVLVVLLIMFDVSVLVLLDCVMLVVMMIVEVWV